ncbi:PQQ-binding-like beta-propeller repeat protein [Micromonospora sp. NPDC005174]|uniref:outer membrane protein assembly factor BamB family protein n=1 Tax=unclassified Micromonospora TaxID=2617518 RepID=UPI0033BBE6E4
MEGRSLPIIELGEVRGEPVAQPTARPPRAVGRPLRTAAVLLLALVALTGATAVRHRTVTSVPTAPGASAYLTEDAIVVVDASTPSGDRYLTVYDQPGPTGGDNVRRRWRAPLERSGDYVSAWMQRGMLLAVGVSTADGVLETTAFDAETGQRRWRNPGIVQRATDGGMLLVNDTEDGLGSVSRVTPDTGRVLWSVPAPFGGTDFHRQGDQVDQVVFVQPTGEVQVYDADTGDLRHSVDTLPGARSAFQRVQVADDLVLLVPPGSTELVAFRLPAMAPAWRSPVPLVAWAVPCADLLCAVQQTGGIQMIDPATGAVRWSDRGPDMLVDVRRDRLLVATSEQRYAVRDARTGRERAELGRWQLVNQVRREDTLLGVRPTPDGRLVVAELDLAAGRTRILDVLPGVVGGCQAAQPVLLCRRLDGSTALWRLPR